MSQYRWPARPSQRPLSMREKSPWDPPSPLSLWRVHQTKKLAHLGSERWATTTQPLCNNLFRWTEGMDLIATSTTPIYRYFDCFYTSCYPFIYFLYLTYFMDDLIQVWGTNTTTPSVHTCLGFFFVPYSTSIMVEHTPLKNCLFYGNITPDIK